MPGADATSGETQVLVDHALSDDAAIVTVPSGRALVLTTDVIAPLVDDPRAFGQIAAANALSDVWAMGGEPHFALNLVFFPDDQLSIEVLSEILAGGNDACRRAGVAIVGGHSVRDPEVKYGLAVTGSVVPDQAWANIHAHEGQVLVLTKALGTGLIGQAIKAGTASDDETAAAIASMTTLNQLAARLGREHGATAATDITGFGLLGHLRNLARGSNVTAHVNLGALPLLPGAFARAAAGGFPGGSKANRKALAPLTAWADGTPLASTLPDAPTNRDLLASIACDAQTSGGLLLCLAADRAPSLIAALRDHGAPAAIIGDLRRGQDLPIQLHEI